MSRYTCASVFFPTPAFPRALRATRGIKCGTEEEGGGAKDREVERWRGQGGGAGEEG